MTGLFTSQMITSPVMESPLGEGVGATVAAVVSLAAVVGGGIYGMAQPASARCN